MTKKKILFVVNNLSGSVRKYNIIKAIELYLDLNIYDFNIFTIDNSNIKSNKIKDTLEKFDIIVSVGGDGTFLELGYQFINSDISIGIIPIGSGNGLASHLGYKPRDIESAFKTINNGKTIYIDAAKVNEKFFFSNLGIGMDAKIAKNFKIKINRNFFVYAWLTLKNIFNLKTNKITFELDGEIKTVESYFFNVFNSNLFGYNVGIIPWAKADDGILDFVYIRKTNIFNLLFIGFAILCKKPKWSKSIVYKEIKSIKVFNKESIEYQIDGDPIISKSDLNINIYPKCLKLIVP